MLTSCDPQSSSKHDVSQPLDQELNVDTDEIVRIFIDQNVKCSIPDDEEPGHLVSKFQKHKHSVTRKRCTVNCKCSA